VIASIAPGSVTRHMRVTVPSSSMACPHGSGVVECSMAAVAVPAGSSNSEKIGERFVFVARVSLSRSSLGPGWVRS